MLKVLFVGMGSIGKRHIRNLIRFCDTQLKIDLLRHGNGELSKDITDSISNTYYDSRDLPDDYNVVFVTNPTSSHYETIKALCGKTDHMFIEKPVFQKTINHLNDIPLKSESIYYVAAPLRYCPVIMNLKKYVNLNEVYSARAITSSYLPDWRKNCDYRNVYSAHKEMGGGVSLDLIHEIDYLTFLFGMPNEVLNMNGKFSHLEIDSDDLSVYLLKYSDKLVEIHLDYFGRDTSRILELYCKEYTAYCDLINNSIRIVYPEKEILYRLGEDLEYEEEMKNFLRMINHEVENKNDIIHANEILRLAIGE